MDLSAENKSKDKVIGFIIKRKVNKLIRAIPKEHLIGLEKIIILDEIPNNKRRDIGGLYRQKQKNQPCSIELSVSVIFKGMPRIFFFFPFIPDFSLADVLYHEIGHHCHKRLTHGIKKEREESFAEKYRSEMVKKRFKWWAPFFIPFSPLIRFLNKKVNKKCTL